MVDAVVQGHLLAHWHCGRHWHINGWDALGDDGIRCAPNCIPGSDQSVALIQLRVVGDATAPILDAIHDGRAPEWMGVADWPHRLLEEEIARQRPPAPKRASRQQSRATRPSRPSVPARTWRAAAEGIIAACLAGRGDTADRRTTARIERDAYRLLHKITVDPVAAWHQLVDATGGDLDAGIAAAMR